MTGTITIDGNEYEYVAYYPDILKIWKVFNNTYSLCLKQFKKVHGENFDVENENHSLPIPNDFYFWTVWTILKKSGPWPFRKPFRSKREMIKQIRQDEFQSMLDLAGRDILKLKWYEDREQGNEKKCHSEDTLIS